jgi:chemotaxis protein CheD
MYENTLLVPSKTQTTYVKKFISLGELYISDSPTHFWTVLGSCVSVVLHNPRKMISAVCHAQLAEKGVLGKRHTVQSPGRYVEKATAGDYRFVGCAIDHMVSCFMQQGIMKKEIIASIYGGASIVSEFTYHIGEENVRAALLSLEGHGIKITEKNMGGGKSRLIRHFSDTGTTHVKIL